MAVLHAVLPADVDDPARPSGGNVYDRAVLTGLAARGWTVHEHTSTATVPDGGLTLVDGLVASSELAAEADRVRVAVLMHLPRGPDDPAERDLLRAADLVIATSRWTRRRLREWYALEADRVRVAEPGVEPADPAPGTETGTALLSVGAITALKGYDVLAEALGRLGDLTWTCSAVGSTCIEPGFAADLPASIRLLGTRTRVELDATYAAADLVVLASRAETYGMVVTEALAHGLPVVATDVGGVREAVRGGGVLVAGEDPVALATALRRWLTDPDHRAALRRAARVRRASLCGWDRTTTLVAAALTEPR